jgi:uncharacterized protein YkwD
LIRPLLSCLFTAGLCVMLGTPGSAVARPSLIGAINAERAAGCAGRRGLATPLRSNRKLDAAARGIARGEKLSRALTVAGYRALHSASMQISNPRDNSDIARSLARNSCEELTNSAVRDIGIAQQGAQVWIVVAAPFAAPELKSAREVNERVLTLANQARARPRRCGSKSFDAAPPLKLVGALNDAALVQARDMARHSMISHDGSDGSTPADRVTRQNYKWRVVGENVASGPTTADEVMQGWLASPHHCENLMDPRFTDLGIGFVFDEKSESGVYWSQVFATPR